ncbi:MAG: YqjF family protein [Myxococcota bacterium]
MAHPALSETAHRPWALPARAWTWRQSWRDLLFAHWPVPASLLRPLVPWDLEIQEFDGTSWIAVVPFRMEGVMRRPLPDVPWISAFPELNVRVYVERDGKPGVFFLSLDASNPLAVWAARRYFFLPYFRAAMSLVDTGGWIRYRSRRRGAEFAARYRPTSDPHKAKPGSLEHFLTERYCLYALAPNGSLLRNEVHHAQWPLQQAELELERNEMLSVHGLSLGGPPPHLLFARRLDVVVYPSERVASPA